MSMIIWKVDFEYVIQDSEGWLLSTACHLGDENGGLAANYVRDKMVGSEVEIKGAITSDPVVKHIVDFRLVGLSPLAKLNTVDIQVLIDCNVIEPAEEAAKETDVEQNTQCDSMDKGVLGRLACIHCEPGSRSHCHSGEDQRSPVEERTVAASCA